MNVGDDGETGIVGLLQSDDDHLVPEVLTHLLDLLDQTVQVRRVDVVPSVPPLLKHCTLLQLIVKDTFRLAQKVAKIRDADVQQRTNRDP